MVSKLYLTLNYNCLDQIKLLEYCYFLKKVHLTVDQKQTFFCLCCSFININVITSTYNPVHPNRLRYRTDSS